MKVFTSNYHISVNHTLVGDLLEAGLEIVLPTDDFADGRIWFFASNEEHRFAGHDHNVHMVDYDDFMKMEPMAILVPCMQHVEDFTKLYKARGEVDQMVYLTANSDAKNWYPDDAEFVMTHDIDFHRNYAPTARKILYWNQPTFKLQPKTDAEIRQTFEGKKVNLYVNNLYKGGFEPEIEAAHLFRDIYRKHMGVEVKLYGYDNPDGWPQPPQTHEYMKDSMFTLCFKRRETWGQMVNESMQLGTPGVFLRSLMYSTFKQYLITEDVALIGSSVEGLVAAIANMTFDQYENLVREAQWASRTYCNDEIRVEKVTWLFDKVRLRLEEKAYAKSST